MPHPIANADRPAVIDARALDAMPLASAFVALAGVAHSLVPGAARACRARTRTHRTTRARTVAVARTPGRAEAGPAPDAESADASVEDGPPQRTDVSSVTETPGGFIVDANVINFSKRTRHTVIVGKPLLEELSEGLDTLATPELVVEMVFDFLIAHNHNLTNTEGLLEVAHFPINYFSARQLFYFYPDARESLRSRISEALKSA